MVLALAWESRGGAQSCISQVPGLHRCTRKALSPEVRVSQSWTSPDKMSLRITVTVHPLAVGPLVS